MHEYSITCSIIEILERIAEEKKLKKVYQVDFDINDFACIEPDSIRFYYEFLTRDNTILGGARLEFSRINARMVCTDCRHVFELNNLRARCPECNSHDVRFEETDDIRITAVHTENP